MRRTFVALMIAGLLAATVAVAGATHKLSVEIPFDFYVGNQMLPAGLYTIDLNRGASASVIAIENNRPGRSALANTTPCDKARSDHRSRLVFQRYGDSFFLSEVWDATAGSGRKVPTSQMERQAATQHDAAPRTLELAFKR